MIKENTMMLADQIPPLAIIFGVVGFVGFFIFVLCLYRVYERLARRSLERKFVDLEIHGDPQPGDVILTYHTYHGFIGWIPQTTHHVTLPPDDARTLLARLLRFNLTWGLITYGTLFILPLAILNYFAQCRLIANQEVNSAFDVSEQTLSADVSVDQTVESPSLFRHIVGWIAACLCVMFAIGVVVFLVTSEFESAIGGFLITALFGWVARDWLGKRQANAA
jgi:hypothetical protein